MVFWGKWPVYVGMEPPPAAMFVFLVYFSARLNRQFVEQIGLVNDAQLLNVFRAVSVHRNWAGLFRRRNIRAGDNNTLGRSFTGRCRCSRARRRRRRVLSKCICYEEK